MCIRDSPGAGIHGLTGAHDGAGIQSNGGGAPAGGHSSHAGFGGGGGRAGGAGAAGAGAIPKNSGLEYLVELSCFLFVYLFPKKKDWFRISVAFILRY